MAHEPSTPRIAQKLIAELNKHRQSKVIDLEAFRLARELAVEQHGKATEDLGDLHPVHALYTYMLTTVADAANALGQLPLLSKLMDRIEAAEEEYMPSGPPMSPLTHSFFINWALFDLTIGIHGETLGSCVGTVYGALGSHASRVACVEQLCRTRPGICVHEGFDGDHVLLHETVTERRHTTIVPSGYRGKPGDILLLRLLPPVLARTPLGAGPHDSVPYPFSVAPRLGGLLQSHLPFQARFAPVVEHVDLQLDFSLTRTETHDPAERGVPGFPAPKPHQHERRVLELAAALSRDAMIQPRCHNP